MILATYQISEWGRRQGGKREEGKIKSSELKKGILVKKLDTKCYYLRYSEIIVTLLISSNHYRRYKHGRQRGDIQENIKIEIGTHG